jgi:hypothetical protein
MKVDLLERAEIKRMDCLCQGKKYYICIAFSILNSHMLSKFIKSCIKNENAARHKYSSLRPTDSH